MKTSGITKTIFSVASLSALIINIGFPVMLDKGNTLASRYGLAGHPETVIISPSGTIIWSSPGPVTKDQLVQTLNKVLSPKSS